MAARVAAAHFAMQCATKFAMQYAMQFAFNISHLDMQDCATTWNNISQTVCSNTSAETQLVQNSDAQHLPQDSSQPVLAMQACTQQLSMQDYTQLVYNSACRSALSLHGQVVAFTAQAIINTVIVMMSSDFAKPHKISFHWASYAVSVRLYMQIYILSQDS